MNLILDIDGTLAASPRVPNGDDFAAWERLILATPPPVIEGSQAGVVDLIAVASRALLLTGRSVLLWTVTTEWINDAFPCLRGVELAMRMPDDPRTAPLSKWDRLDRWRRRHPGPIVLVDDDPSMRVACGDRDRFLLAPGCWMAEARAVAFALMPVAVAHG